MQSYITSIQRRSAFATFLLLILLALGHSDATAQSVVTGRVVDARTSQPVRDATVRVEPVGPTAVTDTDGRFRLLDVEPGASIKVLRLGYAPRSVTISSGDRELTIRLETDVFELYGLTVSANRTEQVNLDQPSNVTILDRQQTERRMMNTIEDLVRYQPGIRVARQTSGTDPFNSLQGFTIRGVSGNRVQIVVDGSRVQERIIDGTRDLVDPAQMKTVEIVRGPASVLWGSDALGGLVAFTTKDPSDYLDPGDGSGFQADAVYSGIDDGRVLTVAGAGRRGPVEALLSYSRRDAGEPDRSLSLSEGGIWPCTRNAEATPCSRLDPTDIGSDNVLAKLVYQPNPGHRFKLTGEFFRRDTDVDQRWDLGPVVSFTGSVTGVQTSYDRLQELERQRYQFEHTWRPSSSPLIDELKWSLAHHPQSSVRTGDRRRTLTDGTDQERDDRLVFEESFTELDVQVRSSFSLGSSDHRLTYGFDGGQTSTDYERVDVTRNLTTGEVTEARAGGFNFANSDTDRFDFYVQDEIGVLGGALSIIPAIRVARYEISPRPDEDYQVVEGKEPRDISETAFTPKLAVMVRDGFLSFYGQYARGFKMPTAQQLYTSLPGSFFVLVPNPDLLPEEVDAWEIGVRAESGRGFLSLNGFFNDYENFIQSFVFIPDTDPQEITYDNLSTATIYGVEASAGWKWNDRLASTLSLSWQRGDFQADEESEETQVFDSAAPLGAVATLRWFNPELQLDAEVNGTFQAGTERVSDVDVFQPGGYGVYGALVEWAPVDRLRLRFSVDNLFDKRYLLPSATAYTREPSSDAVAATNPIELQVQPGRNFRTGISVVF